MFEDVSADTVLFAGLALLIIVDRALAILKSRGVDLATIAEQIDDLHSQYLVDDKYTNVNMKQMEGHVAELHRQWEFTKEDRTKLFKQVCELREWHNAKDENGVFRWWITTQVLESQETNTTRLIAIERQITSLLTDSREVRKKLDALNGNVARCPLQPPHKT